MLSRIHGQMARVFLNQEAPYNALQELKKAKKLAASSKDSMMWLACREQEANAYQILNISDSVVSIREEVSMLYKQKGEEQLSALVLGPIIDDLLDKNKITKAKLYMDFYESKSGLFNKNRQIHTGFENYYFVKGLYYLNIEKYDSAEYFFRKTLKYDNRLNNLEIGNRGLFLLYKRLEKSDSVAKYAELAYELNDSSYRELSTFNFLRMQSLYNYTRAEQIAERKSKEAETERIYRIIAIALLVIVALISYISIYRINIKRNEAIQKEKDLHEKYKTLHQAKKELDILIKTKEIQHVEYTDIIQKKRESIAELNAQIIDLRIQLGKNKATHKEEDLLATNIVQTFQAKLKAKKFIAPSHEEWNELRQLLNKEFPSFITFIKGNYPMIRNEEFNVCILIRLKFPLKDIETLTGITLSNLAMMRKRMLPKVFPGESGGAKTFDKRILSI